MDTVNSASSPQFPHPPVHPSAHGQRIWDHVSASPLHSLWDLQGTPPVALLRRIWNSINDDNLFSRAAELGFYFLFALFPMLISASAVVGLVARSTAGIYLQLLHYLALVVPHDAYAMVLDTFNQTTQNSTSGKITFGFVAAVWSASVGFSAIQSTLNTVYKVRETRPYWKARGQAMLVTLPLTLLVMLVLFALFAGTWLSHQVRHAIPDAHVGMACGIAIHVLLDVVVAALLMMLFATIYYFAPDIQHKRWRWLTPGSAFGILGWFVASIGLRIYLFYFDSYSATYGSLGAVIILLTWFYITGVMLLLGAEINSEIEAAAAERKLKAEGAIPAAATTDTRAPV